MFLCNTIIAQNVTIKDIQTKKNIAYVYILNADTTKTKTSNKNGKVNLSNFSDKQKLIFKHSAYETLITSKLNAIKDGIVYLIPKSTNLPEIEIKASLRSLAINKNDPMPRQNIKLKEADLLNPINVPDVLEKSGNISIQKSQSGGGSPVIRGFEANKILLVIDGVRMNNAIYRSGHLQNSMTLDYGSLENIELHFGPSSVLYGSDALGGVIHFYTKNPKLNTDENKRILFSGNTSLNYQTNGHSLNGHLNLNFGFKKIAFLIGASANKYGNIKMGSNRTHGDSNWGLWNHYVKQFNGKDSTVLNPNNLNQIGTDYNQYDFINKIIFKIGKKYELKTNFQYSTSSNINRNDVLDEYKKNNLKWAEWYYGPQQRIFSSIQFDIKSASTLFHRASIIASYQNIRESRINRRFGKNIRNFREENVNIFGLNMDMVRELDSTKVFYYGFEINHNLVQSSAFSQHKITNFKEQLNSRYPNGGSTYTLLGFYLSYKHKFSHQFLLTTGIRYSHIIATSKFIKDKFIQLPFEEIKFNKGALSGNIGFIFRPNNGIDIKISGSSGFRAPNIDDYGKVFEKNGYVVIPNNKLKPEYVLNGDFGILKKFGWNKLILEANIFYTHLFDAIIRKNTTLQGKDSLSYDGEKARIQTNTNANQAFVTGFSFKFNWMIIKKLNLLGTLNFTRGYDISNNVPLAHIPPIFGKLELNYQWNKFNFSIYSNYNAVKPISEYAPGTTDNLDEAIANRGTPAWATLNFVAGYKIIKDFKVQIGLYNILNHHYKQFASGISASGFNFLIKLKYDF